MTEDYWLRMALAEQKLFDASNWLPLNLANLCQRKALQLSDRYHEHWNPTLYRLEK